jgi:hypothetical protein
VVDPELDGAILDLYHRSMEGGFARRHIVELARRGFTLLGIGSSDWIVPPRPDGTDRDELVLVETILDMIGHSVGEMIVRDRSDLTRDQLSTWIETRREQARAGELLFIAHQLDVLVRR